MDKRIRYIIGTDTETCGTIDIPYVYDWGWAVTDKKGRIYKTKSYVIEEIFLGEAEMMKSAYFANKISTYCEEIAQGTRQLVSFWDAWADFKADIKEYGVKNVFAHNAGFDVRALNNTIRHISNKQFRYALPKEIVVWDTLKMSRQVVGTQKSYCRWCERNGYLTKHKKPQVRLTAEILYRYITGESDFEESHTGLEDVLIETKILVYCFRQHKRMVKEL